MIDPIDDRESADWVEFQQIHWKGKVVSELVDGDAITISIGWEFQKAVDTSYQNNLKNGDFGKENRD